jgi:hypothetical protein
MSLIQCKQNKASETTKTEEVNMTERKQNLVGGWKTIEVTDKIKSLADFVVEEKAIKSPIVNIISAKEQVVSGKNYAFQLLLENKELWEVVVYENIMKDKKITKFNRVYEY